MTGAGTDVQTAKILQGILELEGLLEEPLVREALDLDNNVPMSQNHDLMLRMKRSLTQYVERNSDLLYVGLLGHFSSGKSSTINSLLQLWDAPIRRPVDLNPTDRSITLVTHSSNGPSLLGMISRGDLLVGAPQAGLVD